MDAPVEVEDELREGLRPLAREVVRRLLLDLAREELDRIAASLNGNTGLAAEMVLPGASAGEDASPAPRVARGLRTAKFRPLKMALRSPWV
jgi:hypothetical protein